MIDKKLIKTKTKMNIKTKITLVFMSVCVFPHNNRKTAGHQLM